MFNPFHPFEPRLLPAFAAKGFHFFVAQSFERGRQHNSSNQNAFFLISHYDHPGHAKMHFDAIKADPARQYFDCTTETGSTALSHLIGDTGNACYARLFVRDFTQRAARALNKKFFAYIQHDLQWHVSRVDEIVPEYQVIFGELHVLLKFGAMSRRIKLADIETRY